MTSSSSARSSAASDMDELSPAEMKLVDAACDRFELDWRDGRQPVLEEYLQDVPNNMRQVLLQELLGIELPYRRKLGESVATEHYLRRFDSLDARRFRQINAQSIHSEASQQALRGKRPPLAGPDAVGISVLGDFRLIEEVGRGGMGIVYAAEQITLGRRVALKVLPASHRLNARHLKRFQNEARAAASLQHPNIVPVYAVGSDQGMHFFAMQLIEGKTLADVIEESTNRSDVTLVTHTTSVDSKRGEFPATPRRTSNLPNRIRTIVAQGVQAAEAIEHAHSFGIVHRDIKPGNLMVDNSGKLWVTDFGLARIATEGDLTISGDMLGTLRFMSPEQALAKHGLVDHRTDIYSLGATLYELITLRPAIDGKDRNEILNKIAFEEPVPLRKINSEIPRDLETIILKAMSKEPPSRYQTAEEMADDLRRFIEDRPIKARRRTKLQSLVRWQRRNRALAAALATSLAVILLANVVVVWFWTKERTSHAEARSAEIKANVAFGEASKRAEELQRSVYLQNIALSEFELWSNNVGRAQQFLDRCEPELRNWEWRYLNRLCNSAVVKLHVGLSEGKPNHKVGADRQQSAGNDASGTDAIAYAPDGTRLATGSNDGQIRIWDLATGKCTTHSGHTTTIRRLVFSRDGSMLASTANDYLAKQNGEVIVWRLQSDVDKLLVIPSGKSFVFDVTFSPDMQSLAMADHSRKVRLIDLATRKEREFLGHKQSVKAVAFSPDGQTLVSGAVQGELFLWNVAAGKLDRKLNSPIRDIMCVRFNHTGDVLACGTWNSTILLWDARTFEQLKEIEVGDRVRTFGGRNNCVWSVDFSHDGTTLASGSEDGAVRLWNSDSGILQPAPRSHQGAVRGVAFSPKQARLASSGADGTVRIWDVNRAHLSDIHEIPLGVYNQLSYRPDGGTVATASKAVPVKGDSGRLMLIDPSTGKLQEIAKREAGFHSLAFDSTSRILVADWGKQARIWNAQSGDQIRDLDGHDAQVTAVAALRDGTVVTACQEGTLKVWDTDSGKMLTTLDSGLGPIHALAADRNDSYVAAIGRASRIAVFNRQGNGEWTAASFPDEPGANDYTAIKFSPTEHYLAVANRQGVVQIRDVRDGSVKLVLEGHSGAVVSLDFSPDGRRMVSGGEDGTIILWEMIDGKEALILRKQLRGLSAVAFSPDGSQLAAIDGTARQLHIWNTRLPMEPQK